MTLYKKQCFRTVRLVSRVVRFSIVSRSLYIVNTQAGLRAHFGSESLHGLYS